MSRVYPSLSVDVQTYMAQSNALADQMDVYGMIYTSNGSATQTFTSGVEANITFASLGESRNVTLSTGSIKIQIPGIYMVFFQLTHEWSMNDFIFSARLLVDGVDVGCGFKRFVTNTFAVGIEDSCSFCWIGEFEEDDVLTVALTTDKTGDLTVKDAQFLVRRLF